MSAWLQDILQEIDQAGRRLGLTTAGTSEIGQCVIERLMRVHGGVEVYVPSCCGRPAFRDKRERNASVIAAWDAGMAMDENMKRHGISRTTYYRITGDEHRRRQTNPATTP